jgi:uncharacterized damage-inducible protein DinB
LNLAQSYLAEFTQETRTTRKFLERVPEDRLGWKPHEKSMTAGALALHIATAPAGVVQMAQRDEAPPPNVGGERPQPASVHEILSALDESVAVVESVLPTFSDERMAATWRLVLDGRELLAMPRQAFLRSILLNHWYHHRGQLGVYLRLLGAQVPSSYGPSGDEAPEFLRK